jgi:hypothetical protein
MASRREKRWLEEQRREEWVFLASSTDGRAAREQAMARLAELGVPFRRTKHGSYPRGLADDDLRIDLQCTRGNGCHHQWRVRKKALPASPSRGKRADREQ